MADTSAGFRYRYRMCGGQPTIQKFVAASAATYHKGDMVSLASGECEISATDDGYKILGAVCETTVCDGVATTGTQIQVITDADAVYGVYDANARLMGAPLDVSGATGAMTVATAANYDLLVVAPSSATEETLVMIIHDAHWTSTAKA